MSRWHVYVKKTWSLNNKLRLVLLNANRISIGKPRTIKIRTQIRLL